MAPEKKAEEKKDGMEVEESTANGNGHEKDEFPPFENDEGIMKKIEEALQAVGKGDEGEATAIEKLLSLERINRGAGAAPETAAVCVNLLRIFADKKDWKTLSEYVVMLSKRRAQVKMAIQRMVKEAMLHLDGLDEKTKLSLLETLRDVTAGKIFVELERARLTRTLADIKLSKNDIDGAATIMQEVQVETFSGMERIEKFDFILEQVRLCLEKNDFIRGGIISKKIMPRQLNKDGLVAIKFQYYSLIIRIATRNKEFILICKSYLERFETCKKNKTGNWVKELKLACLFVLLSTKDSQQWDLLQRIQGFKEMENEEQLEIYKTLLKKFSTHELIRWPILMKEYKSDLTGLANLCKEEIKDEELKWESALQERVIEHNLRVLAKYFSRVRMERLSQLLDMEPEETERKLAAMVSDKKALWAKIDRPARIVSFAKPKDVDALLNGWATNVTSLLDTVEKTCHLVHRETMVHSVEGKRMTD